jgi:hypothetical protein
LVTQPKHTVNYAGGIGIGMQPSTVKGHAHTEISGELVLTHTLPFVIQNAPLVISAHHPSLVPRGVPLPALFWLISAWSRLAIVCLFNTILSLKAFVFIVYSLFAVFDFRIYYKECSGEKISKLNQNL